MSGRRGRKTFTNKDAVAFLKNRKTIFDDDDSKDLNLTDGDIFVVNKNLPVFEANEDDSHIAWDGYTSDEDVDSPDADQLDEDLTVKELKKRYAGKGSSAKKR